MLQVINSRGRVLLEVYKAHHVVCDQYGNAAVFYSYRGDGCGGYGPESSVRAAIATTKADAPSARIVGELPNVIS